MSNLQGECVLCSRSGQELNEADVVHSTQLWACEPCYHADPNAFTELVDTINQRHRSNDATVKSLCGAVIEWVPTVPKDETWVYDRREGKVTMKFKHTPEGMVPC